MSTNQSLPERFSFVANTAVLAEVLDFAEEFGGQFTVDAMPSDIFLRIADTDNPALSILRAIEVARGGGDLIMTSDTNTAVAINLKFRDRLPIRKLQ